MGTALLGGKATKIGGFPSLIPLEEGFILQRKIKHNGK
jgi:hypothetical protein